MNFLVLNAARVLQNFTSYMNHQNLLSKTKRLSGICVEYVIITDPENIRIIFRIRLQNWLFCLALLIIVQLTKMSEEHERIFSSRRRQGAKSPSQNNIDKVA